MFFKKKEIKEKVYVSTQDNQKYIRLHGKLSEKMHLYQNIETKRIKYIHIDLIKEVK